MASKCQTKLKYKINLNLCVSFDNIMAFKTGWRLTLKDMDFVIDELCEGEKKRSQMKDIMVQEGDDILPRDLPPPLPQMVLPPIYPLLNIKKSGKEKEIAAIDLILKKIKSQAAEMESIRVWKQVADQKNQLHDLFTTAEIGIKENRASMSRFYEIIKENSKHKIVLDNEIRITKERLEEYKLVEQEFTNYVDRYSIFERFLESVAEVDDNWRNVRDVLDRFETLQSTSIECARILENELEQSADLRKQMMTMVEDKSSTLKGLSNRLIQLEVQRKDARDRRVYWEHMMQRIKYTVLDKMQEAVSLKEGINDLYNSMCNRLRVVPGILSSDTQKQIDFIHKNIIFYKEVVLLASGYKSALTEKENLDSTKSK